MNVLVDRWSPSALALLAAAAVAAGCGDNSPVSYSQPVGITLGVQSKDVSGGTIALSKNINTENGIPYGAFVNAAVQRLGGKVPSRIVVASDTLALLPGATGVSGLQQVFA